MEHVTTRKEKSNRRHVGRNAGALALVPIVLLTGTACKSAADSASNAGDKAGKALGKCMDGGSCALSADVIIPHPIILDCTEMAPISERWAMVTPIDPLKDHHWPFEVDIIGPRATDHNKAWAEVDYKNSAQGGQTTYGYGQGPLPPARPTPILPALNHTVEFGEMTVNVFSSVTPQQGPDGTVDFSCPGAGLNPPAKAHRYEVIFPQIKT
ncbi:MAG TPA: hypothetical protein VLG16_05160 [Candidatus Saccharimonadales bacterium]|nr:hypothetical protein [Candidatus Saccharimonadales bacterium]